jgi:hypothetical protein
VRVLSATNDETSSADEAPVLTHRALAAGTFNASWELLERDRTADEDLALLEVAFASRHHWRIEGGARQIAIADWMVSRCFSELGEGALAVRFAVAAVRAQPADAPPWLRASLLEGLARAHAANGDRTARDEAVARAVDELAAETDEENRELIEDQLASVPDAAC